MSNIPSMRELAQQYGIVFDTARHWITPEARRAVDAVPPLTPNSGIPAEFTQYLDPRVVQILTTPDKARVLFSEVKVGDWNVTHFKFRVDEMKGRAVPYSDYANGGAADVEVNYITREQYHFETTIRYGALESALAGSAKLDLAGERQRSAAQILNNQANEIYLKGVEGKAEVTGFLNDPTVPAPVQVAVGVSSGNTTWATKEPGEIYDDIITAFTALVTASKGLVNEKTPMKLALSPMAATKLQKASQYNVSVADMLAKGLPGVEVVTVPELRSAGGVETGYLYPIDIEGHPVGELAYGDKLRAFQLIPQGSWHEQKFSASVFGCVLYYPFLISGITGM
jgi:hypothetical protein